MSQPAPLVDRHALLQNRLRLSQDACFLFDQAADDLKDRLEMTQREFHKAALVSGQGAYWRQALEMYLPSHTDVVADDETLIFPTQNAGENYDLIIHTMALHWSNDPVGQLIQCARALAPDGLLLVQLFGGQTLTELRTALAHAETTLAGGLSPRVAPMGDIRALGGLLQRAGLALPVADSLCLTIQYREMKTLLHDLRHMGEGNALAARIRRFTHPKLFLEAERHYKEHYQTAQATLKATFEVVTLTGWAPDPSQPQPLKPGSATTRLADALKVPAS